MKALVKIFLIGGLGLAMTACSSTDPYYGNRYPNGTYGNGNVYRAPNGQVYRSGDVYRDRNGNVYQNGRLIRRTNVYNRPGVIQRGNVYQTRRNLPPGQAKKIYGGHATDYARGQQKKRYEQYRKDNRSYGKYKKGNKGKKYDRD